MYPSTQLTEPGWLAFFDTPEGTHAVGRILGDIYDAVKAEEEKEAGLQRMGRRPRRDGSLAEVYATIFPQSYTMEPFTVALRDLLRGRSQRAFAPRVPMDQSTLSRLMAGSLQPDLVVLERIALAAKVHPGYFVEYRAQFVGKLMERIFTQQPNMGVKAFRQVNGTQKALPNR